MVVQAYILIQTDVGKAADVARAIAQVKGVTLAEDVTGPYDVIVRAEARNVDELGRSSRKPLQVARSAADTCGDDRVTGPSAHPVRSRASGRTRAVSVPTPRDRTDPGRREVVVVRCAPRGR